MANIYSDNGVWNFQPDKKDTISGDDILKHKHSFSSNDLPLPGPDYKRRVKCYISKFKEVGTSSSNTNWIFLLHYPCFFIATRKGVTTYDNDILFQMSSNLRYSISYYVGDGNNTHRWNVITSRDPSYQLYLNTGSQAMFNAFPLGATNYFHHIATGAIGSNDSGDNAENWDAFLIPYYGTPKNTLLATFYNVTYKGEKVDDPTNTSSTVYTVSYVSNMGLPEGINIYAP